jgi:ferredoxin-NADP reductase/Na+-translocating ferredoxin:NAD+ oxidoreductase RnfD subunit
MWRAMFKSIDSLTDKLTMYRLLLYYLIGLLLAAVGLSIFGDLHFKPLYILISTLVLVVACWTINKILARIFNAPVNAESSIITGLILALIITPNPTGFGITFLLAAAGLAMASKYILTIKRKHIFNPAAIAVVLTALGPRQSASWWVGAAAMLPFVLIGGVLIARKIHRGRMVLSLFASAALATIIFSLIYKAGIGTSLHNLLLGSPLFFLGFVMLTEPLTSPPSAKGQTIYAALVGILLPPQVHLFSLYSTPELALVVGNAFSYLVSPKTKLFPVLKDKLKIANNTADFIFRVDDKLSYQPGQYMEWTLPHAKADSRGNRRYFTLASSPTEPDLRIGVKFYENGSSFKDALIEIDKDTPLVASQIAGDFVLPDNPAEKIVFIAGGIGITPFRSMVKYLIDTNQHRAVSLLYSAKTKADVAYKEVFEEARRAIGLDALYVLTADTDKVSDPNTHHGFITPQLIKKIVPDYTGRTFYISGTHSMVKDMQTQLSDLGVARHRIKTDYFPGYS